MGVTGESGTALAIPTPHPRAVKLQAPPITAAVIIVLRFTMHPLVRITIGPSRSPASMMLFCAHRRKKTLGLRRVACLPKARAGSRPALVGTFRSDDCTAEGTVTLVSGLVAAKIGGRGRCI